MRNAHTYKDATIKNGFEVRTAIESDFGSDLGILSQCERLTGLFFCIGSMRGRAP